jgi:DNA-binding beta-propeller fold protein YncE
VTSRRAAFLAVAALGLGALPPAQAQRVYVANQQGASVAIIDAATNTLVETVDLRALGFSANAKPHHVAVEPDGSFWYVTLIGDGYVVKFDRANRVVGKAPMETPGMLALDTGSDRLFASRSMTAVNPPSRIGIIRRGDMSIEEVDVLVPKPHAIAVAPGGRYVYVGSLGANQIATVDVQTEQATVIQVPGQSAHVFVQFAVSPDGKRLVASGQLSNRLLVFDAANPARLALLNAVEVGAWPWDPAFTPDGKFVWLGNQRASSATILDAATWQVLGVVRGDGLAEPHGLAVSPDGRFVYVASHTMHATGDPMAGHGMGATGSSGEPGVVAIIDAAQRKVIRAIQVGPYATGVGIGQR